ncbi:hypothetical protein EYF80_032615 [Liparis tanakae]|uniref:Uncharacterized protein n=1 Tax=Liparis tanakae TaxID=230148 RepID=A0A4Z2GVR8_9TELE|nr:hypothetical protein EYF80_032615 [Liparis tanakae]
MGRRSVEVTREESSQLTTGVKTSNACKSGLFDWPPPPLRLPPATAAAATQTASTKPEAGRLVAGGRLSDGSEAASLQGRYLPASLTFKGTVCLASADPRSSFSVHAAIDGKASVSAQVAQQPGARELNSNTTSEVGSKTQYYRDLCLQVEERKQLMERERSRDVVDEQKHNDTMQHTVWGRPGSGAPNRHLGTARRSGGLLAAGILPQEQVNKGLF